MPRPCSLSRCYRLKTRRVETIVVAVLDPRISHHRAFAGSPLVPTLSPGTVLLTNASVAESCSGRMDLMDTLTTTATK